MKKYNDYLFFLLIVFVLNIACSPQKRLEKEAIKLKQYTFSELDELMTKESRPIAVFLHTTWCKFCGNMAQTSLQKASVAKLLNKQYYFLPFDGEQKEAVVFQDQVFRYQARGSNTGTHELAIALGTVEEVLSYPGFILLNEKYEIIFQHNSFMTGDELESVLKAGLLEKKK